MEARAWAFPSAATWPGCAEGLRDGCVAGEARDRRRFYAEPGWMEGFGKLRRLRKETARIQAVIDEAFDTVEPEYRL